jgi:glycosyltransferase involved in cell wall biosynthesis
MTRRRILCLLPFPPDPGGAHGGSRVMGQLLESLLDLHDVGVLYLEGRRDGPISERLKQRLAVAAAVERRNEALGPLGRTARFVRRVAGLIRGRPVWVTDWCVPAYAERVTEIARDWKPDIVQAEFHVMGQYVGAATQSSRATVLVNHEPGAAAAADRADAERGLARLLRSADAKVWQRWEARVLRIPDVVVAFNAADRDALLALEPVVTVTCIPIATTVPEAALDATGSPPPRVLFVGSFVHPPNVDAAVRLAHSIFPLVRARVPAALLEIVGSHPPRTVQRLASNSIRVIGTVSDVEPYLARAAVVAAPLKLGGGTRVKVLEALAAGKAVVASPVAIRGLDITPGTHLLVAETEKGFADAVVTILENPEKQRALAAAARTWAMAQPRWPDIAAEYARTYERLLTRT